MHSWKFQIIRQQFKNCFYSTNVFIIVYFNIARASVTRQIVDSSVKTLIEISFYIFVNNQSLFSGLPTYLLYSCSGSPGYIIIF